MVTWFPELFDDELLYSAVARYARLDGVAPKHRKAEIARRLIGRNGCTVSTTLPCYLKSIVTNFPSGHSDAHHLLARHSLFPAVASFLNADQVVRLQDQLLARKFREKSIA